MLVSNSTLAHANVTIKETICHESGYLLFASHYPLVCTRTLSCILSFEISLSLSLSRLFTLYLVFVHAVLCQSFVTCRALQLLLPYHI